MKITSKLTTPRSVFEYTSSEIKIFNYEDEEFPTKIPFFELIDFHGTTVAM